MNHILYKFKSEKLENDWRIIELYDQNYITVGDLKKRICNANKMVLTKKNSFDLVITNPETKEEYTDTILIPATEKVLVSKIPKHPPEILEKTFKTGNDTFAGIPRSLRHADPLEWVPPPIVEKKPEIILCGICQNEIDDSAMTPCCRKLSCYDCITEILVHSEEHECPYCHKHDILPSEVITGSDIEVEKSEDLKKTSNDQPMQYPMTFHHPVVATYDRQATIGAQPFRPATPGNQGQLIMGSQKHVMPLFQPNQLNYDQRLQHQPTHNYTDPQQPGPAVSIYPGQATMGVHQYGAPFNPRSQLCYDQRLQHQPTHNYIHPQPPGPAVSIYPGHATMGAHDYGMPFHQPNQLNYDQRLQHQPTHSYTDPQLPGPAVSMYPGHATMGAHHYGMPFHQPNQLNYDQRLQHQPTHSYTDPQLPGPAVSMYPGHATMGAHHYGMPFHQPNQLNYDQRLQHQPTHSYIDPQPPGPAVSIYPGHATMGAHHYGMPFHQPIQLYYDQRLQHPPTHSYTDPQRHRSIPPNQGVVPKVGYPYTGNPQPAFIEDPLEEFNRLMAEKDREKKSRPSKRDRSNDPEDNYSYSRSKRNRRGDD